MPSILEGFVRHVREEDSDVNESDEIQKAEKRYLRGKKCAEETGLKDIWQARRGFHAV